jgi:hypothetical protein
VLSDRYKGRIKRIFSKFSWINPFKVKKNANGTTWINHKPFILNITSFIGSIIIAVSIYLINVFRAGKPELWRLTKAEIDRIGKYELNYALETARAFKGAEIFYKGFWQKTYKYIAILLLPTAIWGTINSIRIRHKSALRIMAKRSLEPVEKMYWQKASVYHQKLVQDDIPEQPELPFSSPCPEEKRPIRCCLRADSLKVQYNEINRGDIITATNEWRIKLNNANKNKFGFKYWKFFLFFREDNYNTTREQVNFPGRGMLNFLFPLAITFISEWIIKKGVNECCQRFEIIYKRNLHDPNINWKNSKLLAIEAYGEAGKEIWTFAEFKSVILYCLVPLSVLAGISLFGIFATYGINRIRAYYPNGKEEIFETIPGRDGYYRTSENEPLLTFKT